LKIEESKEEPLEGASGLKMQASTKHISKQPPQNPSWQCPNELLLEYIGGGKTKLIRIIDRLQNQCTSRSTKGLQ